MQTLLLVVLRAQAECVTLVDDVLTDGGTDGDVWGGNFTGSGWVSEGGSLVYNLPQEVDRGQFVLEVAGLEEDGLSQTDVGEMFTAHDASFSDGLTHSFLQLKMAGDVYDGYAGRIKLQIGGEYGDMELAEWSGERDWSAGDAHSIAVTWGDGYATMKHDGAVVAEVDYAAYNGGFVPFESLRIPNDARYAFDPVMSELRYTHVWLCGEAPEGVDPPTIQSFDVQPREVAQFSPFTVSWSAGGDTSSLQACGRARSSGALVCTAVSGLAGSLAVASELLAVDTWDLWLEVSGPGGTTNSGTVALVVQPQGWAPGDTGGATRDTGPSEDAGDDGRPGGTPGGGEALPGATHAIDGLACGCDVGGGPGFSFLAGGAALCARRRRRGPVGS